MFEKKIQEQMFQVRHSLYHWNSWNVNIKISLSFLIWDLAKIYIKKEKLGVKFSSAFLPWGEEDSTCPRKRGIGKLFVVTYCLYFQIKNAFKIFTFQKLFNGIKNIWKLSNGVKNVWCEQCLLFLLSCQTFENLFSRVT
jgi:hypothetical protein